MFVLESLSKLFVVLALVWVLLCDQLKLSSDWTAIESLSSARPSAAPVTLSSSSWDQYWCSWAYVIGSPETKGTSDLHSRVVGERWGWISSFDGNMVLGSCIDLS